MNPERRERTLAAMRAAGVDLMLVTPGADMFYLTGFTHGHANRRLLAFALRADGSSHWISPSMNVAQIREVVGPQAALRSWDDGEGYLPALREAVDGSRVIAFDEEARAAFLMDLLSVAPQATVGRASGITEGLRIRKGADELTLLRKAAATVDETIAEAIGLCRPGKAEVEVEEELRAALGRRSPESEVGFTIVASGPNGALPHHDTGKRRLERGDVVILDYGTVYRGYLSDITVTCSVGEPADSEARRIYRVVWEAQQRALEAIRPGVPCGAVDAAARGVIEAAGFGEYFLHRTGHGLGLQIHEPPFIVPGGTRVLEEGMVFSVEPGIYLEGRFGVRLEVIASVGAQGVELINSPRVGELPCVDL